MAGFDELIERLLYDVALSGSEGFDADRFESAVRAFYNGKNEISEGDNVESRQNPLFADAPPVEKTAVDDKLLASVLEWLCRHPEVELRRVPTHKILSKNTEMEAPTSPVKLKLDGKRIFTTEDRVWHAIAGHGIDLRRIPQLEFDILSIIAAYGSTGVLQPHITMKTGQDKRSVPKRTDRLQERGYITKETVIGSTGKTSLLKLKRFSNIQSLERSPEETEINNQKPIIHYDKMYNTMMSMLQGNNGTVTTADLRIGLGIDPGTAGRREGKILARCIRRLEEGGCIRRVTAKMVDAEGNAMDTIGNQHWRRAKAVQLIRPPTQYDRLLWKQSDPQLETTASGEEEERDDAIAAIDAAVGSGGDDDEEDGLEEVGEVEEVMTSAEQIKALGQKAAEVETAEDDDDDLNDLDRLLDRVPPQWTPNVPLVNILFNKIDEAGESGISSSQLQAYMAGPLWRRPLDECLSHLTDIWQHSQPPHLRHLTIVRDTAVFGRSAQFKYRTLPNFEKAVTAGKAVWNAVLDTTSSRAKKDPLKEKPDLDSWGFPKVPPKLQAGRDGRATLADGRKGCQVERMLDLDTEQDDGVAEGDADASAAVSTPKPTTGRAKKASGRKRKSVTQYESTATTPQIRSPRTFHGLSANGIKMGRPPRERSETQEQASRSTRPSPPVVAGATAVERRQETLQDTPQQSTPAVHTDRSIEGASAPRQRVLSLGSERPKIRGNYLHSKQYTLKHPEFEWIHRGKGRYSRASGGELPTKVFDSETESGQRRADSADHIGRQRTREVTEEEIKEYDAFATRTAENRVRLELNARRKGGAHHAGRSNIDSIATELRTETGEARSTTEDARSTTNDAGDTSGAAAPMAIDQLSSARIEALKKEILDRKQPGAYINPPGAREMKVRSFSVRGRPRKAKIAVFKSERMHEFDWFKNDRSLHSAHAKPLGGRHPNTGRSPQISDDRVTYSGSDHQDMRRASKQQTTFAEVIEVSDPEPEAAGHVTNSRKISASFIDNSDSESTSPVRKRQRTVETIETQVDGQRVSIPNAHGTQSTSPTFGTLATARDSASNGTTNSAPAHDRLQQISTSVQIPNAVAIPLASKAVQDTTTPHVNEVEAQSKTNAADNAAFYLARYKTEERVTALQQYTRLSAKPGRKSSRDLEILVVLERVIGPQPRARATSNKLQPTEIPNPISIAEAHRQLQASLDHGRALGNVTTIPSSTNGFTPVNATQSVPLVDGDSTDDSGTDTEDWATPRLSALSRNTNATPASTANMLSLEQAMKQAVTPQPMKVTARPVAKTATSTEYFSSAYVDTHPDEMFYHAGGGRWRRGKPPPGHYTQAWRGPGAPDRLAPLPQRQAVATQPMTPTQMTSWRPHIGGQVPASSPNTGGERASSLTVHMPLNSPSQVRPSGLLVARPYMTPPVPKASPLMIVRPYETPNANSQDRLPKPIESARPPVMHSTEAVDETPVDDDTAPELQESVGLASAVDGADEMDIDVTEQANSSMTEVGLARALKPVSTQKKTGGVKLGGSTRIKRHEIIMSAVRQCGGVFPGDQEIWYVIATAWKKLFDKVPDRHTVEGAVDELVQEKKLKRFQFHFKSKRSATITKHMLVEPAVNANDAAVTQLRKRMMGTYPLQYLPAEVDINDEFRKSASSNTRSRKRKNGDTTLLEPRPEEYPLDPVLVVKQTAEAAAKADEDAQKKGFANAQALRQHMNELNHEARVKSWQVRTEMQRKERRAIAEEEELIAADLAIEESELIGDDAGEGLGQKRKRRVRDPETGELPPKEPRAMDIVPDGVELLNADGKRRRRKRDPVTGELLPLAPLKQSTPRKIQEPSTTQTPDPATLAAALASIQPAKHENDNGPAPQQREDIAAQAPASVLPETRSEHYVPPVGQTHNYVPPLAPGDGFVPPAEQDDDYAPPAEQEQEQDDDYIPPEKPVRIARKPLGSTRGPARERIFGCDQCSKFFARRDNLYQHQRTHGPPKRWYDYEKRLFAATVAHIFSPAQTFTPSNGTFGTSGCGTTQHVLHMRGGTLTKEQYEAETARTLARDAARIKRYAQQPVTEEAVEPEEVVGAQKGSSWSVEEDTKMINLKEIDGLGWRDIVAQLPGRTENSARFRYSAMVKNARYVAPPSIILKLSVPKEKLHAIISSPPNPVSAKRRADDEASLPDAPAEGSEAEAEPPRKRRKYASRKKKQTADDWDMDDSDDDFVPGPVVDFLDDRANGKAPKLKGPGVRGLKRTFTTRDRNASSGFKDIDRLVVAIALISAIAGGLSQDKMNWSLIAHALSYRYEGEFLRRRWERYRGSRRADVNRIRDAIRQPFLEAYEKDELPVVNLQATHETDWPALHDWVMANIPMQMSVSVNEIPDVPDLPASKHLLEENFTINMREPVFELNKDDYFTTITDQNRKHIAQRLTFGDLIPGEVKPCDKVNNELLLAKSWVRAVAMTKQHKYVPEIAAKKISVLGNKALKKVSTDMVEAKMFLRDKRGRQLPGRNFQIHHEVLVQFRRWPATKEIDEHRYLCALAESWVNINDYFKQADELVLTPITSDQDYTILTNLVASGMATMRPVLPPITWEFNAPLPRLSPWGYTGNSYQTKKADPDQLKYDLVYTKTENYKYDHELNTNVPIPLAPATIEGEPGPRIPFWVDIHGNLIDDIWDMSLRSILHLLVFRSGIRSLTMQLAHSHKLWQWEIDMILGWMEKAGLARRCGDGQEVDGIWNGGWTAGKWWFCAFLPEMIKWEPPMMGGFVEVG